MEDTDCVTSCDYEWVYSLEYTEKVVTYFLLTEHIGIRGKIFPITINKKKREKLNLNDQKKKLKRPTLS